MDRPIPSLILKGNISENWKKFLQRSEIFATASELDKKEEKTQCAQLLHLLGEEAIQIYNTFTFKDEEVNKINILKQKFSQHFSPKKNITYERYKFFTHRQGHQKIEQFITELKNIASQCEFEKLKDELIKTMIIIGIKDETLRERLLDKEDTELDKVVECCIHSENSRSKLKFMQSREVTVEEMMPEVDSIQRNHRRSQFRDHHRSPRARSATPSNHCKFIKKCSRCGNNHYINKCPAFGKTCSICKKLNHFASTCRSKNKRHVNEITDNDSNKLLNINYIYEYGETIKQGHCLVNVIIDKKVSKAVKFKIDTGASANIISVEQLTNCKFDLNLLSKCHENLITYTGSSIPILGKCCLNLDFYGKSLNKVEFYVMEIFVGFQNKFGFGTNKAA